MPKIIVIEPHKDLRKYSVALEKGELVVGRLADNHIYLETPTVSANHCKIIRHGKGYQVIDLDSTSGCFYNGQLFKRLDIVENLEFFASDVLIKFEFTPSEIEELNKVVAIDDIAEQAKPNSPARPTATIPETVRIPSRHSLREAITGETRPPTPDEIDKIPLTPLPLNSTQRLTKSTLEGREDYSDTSHFSKPASMEVTRKIATVDVFQPMNFDATSYLIDFEKDVQLAGIGTRIGGDPDWIEKAQWPVDQSDPLKEFRFVSQFKIPIELFPDSNAQIAYFFIKDSENGDGNSSIPTVILSPGTNDEVVTEKKSVGSTVLRRVPKRDDGTDIFPENFEKKPCLAPIQRGHMVAAAKNKEPLNKMGGRPDFVQGSQFPDEEQKWLLLFQFNKNTVPFEMDLPEDSMCYGFINEDGTQCKVVIQKR